MSYTFLLDAGEESSAESFWDIPALVLSRLNLIAEKSSCNGSGMDACPSSPSGMMSEPLMENHGGEKLTLCAEDSPVKTSALPPTRPAEVRESPEREADCGPRWPESFARFNLHSCSWKTAQCSLLGGWEPFSETWPDWGMMRDGECSARPTPAWSTKGKEFSYMPTITKTQIIQPVIPATRKNRSGRLRKIAKTGTEGGMSWGLWMLLHGLNPTPKAAEYFMSWPTDWTDLQPLETAKFQQWLNSHGKPCPEGADT